MALLGLLAGPSVAAHQEVLPGPATAGQGTATGLSEGVQRARAKLAAAEEDVAVLAIHARTLIDADDVVGLHDVLLGRAAAPTLAVLQALQTTDHTGLVPELLAVASKGVTPEICRLAQEVLERLGADDPRIVDELLQWLDERTLPPEQLGTIVSVLGRTRDLAAVEPLIEELSGPFGAQADVALRSLTGQTVGPDEPWPSWPAFWAQKAGVRRDVLLEEALERERRTKQAALQRMTTEVSNARIERMGSDVDKLVAALDDAYVAVRLEAARRLAGYPNLEQAVSAVPRLLQRLGHGAVTGTNGTHDPPSVETDPGVRVALIAALGVLGRGQLPVRQALLAELEQAEGEVAAKTVEAFGRTRDQPEIVAPLLDFLQRGEREEGTVVSVLDVVAANRPEGRLDALAPWLLPAHSPRVRAAAVRAILAGTDVGAGLDRVEPLADPGEVLDVRYALAMAVGHRLRDLPAEHEQRRRMLELLRVLAADADASVRASAAGALGLAGDELALAILEQCARTEHDGGVMERIFGAFGELGQGVETIGRVCGSWTGEDVAVIEEAAQRALLDIGGESSADEWLAMATTLEDSGAYRLAAWALRDTLHRLESSANERDVLSQVRGRLAVVLCRAGAAEEAHALLVQLHHTQAAHPPTSQRLELLAQTSEQLGRWAEAADWHLERLAQLAEGDSGRLPTQRRAAEALVRAGRHADARPLLLELLDVDGSDNGLMYLLAEVQVGLGEDALARGTLTRLLARVPPEDMAFLSRVQALLDALEPQPGPPPPGGAPR